MADSFIQVAPDSTGKQLQTYVNTISAQPVHAEAVVLVDSTGTPITTLPVSGTFFQATQPISGTVTATGPITDTELRASPVSVSGTFFQSIQPVSGTVNAAQNGTWNITALTSITNPVTVAQSNASNLAATVSGTVAATQTGTWNIGTVTTITNPVTVAAGTNLNTALLATAANQTSGSEKTQIVDGSGNVIGSNANALNVYLSSITANSGTNLNTGNVRINVFQGAATLASGQIIIGNISTTIAGSRPTRRSATIRNQDTANSGYIGGANVGIANGILLYPGDSMSVDFVGVIAGISLNTTNAGNVTFGYIETYD